MLIKIPDTNSLGYPIIYREGTQDYLDLHDELLISVYNQISFEYFKEDFDNFLRCQHEDFVIPSGHERLSWKILWETYIELQDQNVAAWDTFEDVLEEAWGDFGHFECVECGKKLLGALPETDRNGHVYCDACADEKLDFCEQCNERYLKTDLTYVEDGVDYCENCLSEGLVQCEYCGEKICHKDAIPVCVDIDENKIELWCGDCVSEVGYHCKVCGRYFDDPYDGVQVFRTDIVCGECYDKKYDERCSHCKHDLFEEDYRDDGSFCEDCYLKHADE